MIGSLNKIWPWKNTLEWGLDRHGEQMPVLQENVLPGGVINQDPNVRFSPCFSWNWFCIDFSD